MRNEKLRVLIAGGGIGGLTAAVALRRIGCEVLVFERAPELRAVGAGISLQPNAIAALRTIGLAEEVIAAGHRSGLASILKPDGRTISRMDIGAAWPAEAGVTLHRATLQSLLAAAAAPGALRPGAEVVACEHGIGSVRAVLADGSEIDGDLLIGADGIRSAVRGQLLGDGDPLYAGYYCWRGVCPRAGLQLEGLSETWGRGRRFGLVPIDGDRVYFFAVVNGEPGGRDQPGRLAAHLAGLFAGWHAPISEVIARTPETAMLRGDIFWRRPSPIWGEGRITLLGDAAHPMTPDLGQGACQAIEDAVVLAACVEQEADPVAALRKYEGLRQPRTAEIVKMAARMGDMAQWQNPLAAGLRDLLNSSLPEALLLKQVAKLWRFPGPAPAGAAQSS